MAHKQGTSNGAENQQSSSLKRVRQAAAKSGISLNLKEFPDGTRTAEQAASAVGCEVGQIVKSMVFEAEGKIVLALTSGANQVDPVALAEIVGVTKCGRADADQVRAETGFAIGGVAPIGHLRPIDTWIDEDLFQYDTVWAAAGTPRHVFGVAPTVLTEVAGATKASFGV